MKRMLRTVGGFFLVTTGLWAVGQVVARRIEGDVSEDDSVFEVAAIWGGRRFASRAAPLLAGSARVVLGGAEVDLTDASPDPEGARLSLSAHFGGIHVRVPAGWRVEVAGSVRAGDVHVGVTPLEDLPEDAPLLLVDVAGRAGGIAIEAVA